MTTTYLHWRRRFLLTLIAWAAVAQVAISQERSSQPFTAASLRSAADYLKELNGHAMLVYHRDELVFEEYFNGWSADQPHRLASGTKSFSGAMLAAAVEDGLLTLDEKAVDTIAEWKDDPRKSQYGPIPYQIFGELMRRKLATKNESVEAYMKRRILEPIGLKVSRWVKDVDGNVHLPNGMSLTAREWAKYGKFVLHQAKWDGRPIVPWNVLKECFVGSHANPNYGITFWLKEAGNAPNDLVFARGRGSQRLYIIPSLELIIVQFAETEIFDDGRFLGRLLVNR